MSAAITIEWGAERDWSLAHHFYIFRNAVYCDIIHCAVPERPEDWLRGDRCGAFPSEWLLCRDAVVKVTLNLLEWVPAQSIIPDRICGHKNWRCQYTFSGVISNRCHRCWHDYQTEYPPPPPNDNKHHILIVAVKIFWPIHIIFLWITSFWMRSFKQFKQVAKIFIASFAMKNPERAIVR